MAPPQVLRNCAHLVRNMRNFALNLRRRRRLRLGGDKRQVRQITQDYAKSASSGGGGNWPPPPSLRILAHSCVFIAYFARRRHVTQFYAYYAGLRIHFKTLEKKKITQCSRRRRINGAAGAAATAAAAN